MGHFRQKNLKKNKHSQPYLAIDIYVKLMLLGWIFLLISSVDGRRSYSTAK